MVYLAHVYRVACIIPERGFQPCRMLYSVKINVLLLGEVQSYERGNAHWYTHPCTHTHHHHTHHTHIYTHTTQINVYRVTIILNSSNLKRTEKTCPTKLPTGDTQNTFETAVPSRVLAGSRRNCDLVTSFE